MPSVMVLFRNQWNFVPYVSLCLAFAVPYHECFLLWNDLIPHKSVICCNCWILFYSFFYIYIFNKDNSRKGSQFRFQLMNLSIFLGESFIICFHCEYFCLNFVLFIFFKFISKKSFQISHFGINLVSFESFKNCPPPSLFSHNGKLNISIRLDPLDEFYSPQFHCAWISILHIFFPLAKIFKLHH